MKKFEMVDGTMGYWNNGVFAPVKVEVKYFRHYCEYIEPQESLDDAIDFAKFGHDSDDMAFVGIIVNGKLYETRDAWFHCHMSDTFEELKQKIIKETLENEV